MKNLSSISVFKVIVLSLLAYYINHPILYLLLVVYFSFSDYKSLLMYIFVICLLFYLNSIKCDFIPIGIVDYSNSSYYIVDKFLYKVKLINDNQLNCGDVLLLDNFKVNKYSSELKKNVQFYGYEYKYLFNFYPRLFIVNRINLFQQETQSVLLKFLYSINTYDDLSFNIGYGISSYYLFKFIYKKNRAIGIVSIVIYSILFVFNCKFYLILLNILIDKINTSKINKLGIKILIIYIMNSCLLLNYSILIPLLINIYQNIDRSLNFKGFFAILESFLFGEIRLFSSYFYRYYLYFQIIILLLSFVVLFIPNLEYLYIKVIILYSNLNNLDISIRGSLSFIIIFILIYMFYVLKIKNLNIHYFLILLLIISPVNNCIGHISFIDVGHGDATLIYLPFNKGTVLIDTGSSYNYYKLRNYLFKQGIYQIDYLVISHNDEDHNGNVDNLNNDFKIINTITTPQDIKIDNLELKNYYLGKFDNDNDNSLVYGFKINGLSYLFVGDISKDTERVFVNKYGPINFDILKVSHHGSYTASSKYFIGNILPSYAVISTSGKYGHPATSTIENLNNYLVKYFITKYDSNVEFYFLYKLNIIKSGLANFVIIKE